MRTLAVFLLATLAWPVLAPAQVVTGKDWQLVCDNTRTCRAAGYQREGDDAPVSVLFTREAGPGSGVYGELSLSGNADAPANVKLTIAGKPAASVTLERQARHAVLPGGVVEVLLKALAGNVAVAFTAGKNTWRLSGDGARDVLAQMDELQGRSGTTTAIVQPGALGADNVKLRLSVPTLQAVRIGAPRAGDAELAARIVTMIAHHDDCPLLDSSPSGEDPAQAPRLWRVDANRVLVTLRCSAGTDGAVAGYWIANARPPFAANAVTLRGTAFDGVAALRSAPADHCGGVDQTWTWNGFQFELTSSSGSGLCRGAEWNLPTVITQVIPAK